MPGFGNVIFQPILNTPAGIPFNGAENGTSVNTITGKVVLGQDVGEVGNPGFMITNRQIPLTNTVLILTYLLLANADIRSGAIQAGRLGIHIRGAEGGARPTVHLVNATATTFKDWQWEAVPTDTGQLVLNDNIGNLILLNRLNMSFGAPVNCFQNVLDTAANLAIGLTPRSRHVITNRGAGALITIQLPTPNAGTTKQEYTFAVVNGFNMTIQATGGATIRAGALVSLANGTITSTAIGDTIRLQALNPTEWMAIAIVGNWVTP